MKLIVFMSLFLIGSTNCLAGQTEHKEIQSVIDAFDHSIRTKDKSQFLSLFVDSSKPMIAVVTEAGLKVRQALVKKHNKEENKNLVATRSFELKPEEVIEMSLSRKTSSREEMSNIKIISDGNIANVYFDYVYYIDNKKNNSGRESWQMIQTLTGWRISSVIYSIDSK